MIPAVLTIAASDPSGGAGIEADLKVFARHGCFGMSAITALTVQNAAGLQEVRATPVEVFRKILRALAADQPIRAIKIGALPNIEIVEAAADFLAERKETPVVLDPVLKASRGGNLSSEEVEEAIRRRLLPGLALFTPNLLEAEVFGPMPEKTPEGLRQAGERLIQEGVKAVLFKGGHGPGDPVDVLVEANGLKTWKQKRLPGVYHGLGCALSSAIAANLAKGRSVLDAVEWARTYVLAQMKKANIAPGGIKVLPHT